MKKNATVSIALFFCLVALSDLAPGDCGNAEAADMIGPMPEAEFRSVSTQLWEKSTVLLRAYIVAAMNDSKDANEARDKLLVNAGDLGASIQPYYGYWARSILTGFLKKDVALAGKVIKAAKSGTKSDLEWANKKWRANAFLLAGFFAIARNQTMSDLTDILYKHLDLVLGEIQAILNKDKEKELECFEKDRAHMLMFSNMLADGIVKQFPNKFK